MNLSIKVTNTDRKFQRIKLGIGKIRIQWKQKPRFYGAPKAKDSQKGWAVDSPGESNHWRLLAIKEIHLFRSNFTNIRVSYPSSLLASTLYMQNSFKLDRYLEIIYPSKGSKYFFSLRRTRNSFLKCFFGFCWGISSNLGKDQ